MGAAQDVLGPADRARIARETLAGVDDLKSDGVRVWAHCPFHQEKSPGGAFDYNAEKDFGYCRSCGDSSDLVGIWCLRNGYDERDPDGFKVFMEQYVDAGAAPRRRDKPIPKPPQGWQPKEKGKPSQLWMAKARQFTAECRRALQRNKGVLAQLAAWGISPDVADKCWLGWNREDRFHPFTKWGLDYAANDKGNERHVYLPAGLVIPNVYLGGDVLAMKIRRAEVKEGELKYYFVAGGVPRYFVYGRPDLRVWLVVETERDAAMLWGVVHGLGMGTMGTGSASAQPDDTAARILRGADLVLNMLDTDQAGAKATWGNLDKPWQFSWAREFPQSVRRPIPAHFGKDLGDAVGKVDLREFVLACLPGHTRARLPRAAEPEPPAREPGPDVPGEVAELVGLLRENRLALSKDGGQCFLAADGVVTPSACPAYGRMKELLRGDVVQAVVAALPDGKHGADELF